MTRGRDTAPTHLGVPPHLYAVPLWLGLRAQPGLSFSKSSPGELAIKLRAGQFAAALISPLDYARNYTEYQIVPGVSITSAGESNTVLLHFNKGLRNVSSIAADPAFAAEIVLAKIILRENFHIEPTIIPTTGTVGEMLRKADAALHVTEGIQPNVEHRDAMDMVDEWSDVTGLPYVHCMWAFRENSLRMAEMNLLSRIADHWVLEAADLPEEVDRKTAHQYFHHFGYTLDDSTLGGITEFLRMAYYHHILENIPDVKIFGRKPSEA